MSDYKLIDIARLTKFKEKLLGILTYSSPTTSTSSTSIEFIDTVSQSNGKISASKKKVSTFEGGNTAGLVPAPGTNASGTFLGSNGQWSKPTGTTYNDYKFSTTTKAGAAGLVPQPGTSAVGKFLKGDSGWSDLPTASTSNSGIVKLDNSTNSTSTTTAATPNAIKAVYTAAVNAASNAGATAGANAASSYATAAKNSADSASTYATNAKNSADSAASAANTAVTNKINGLSYNDPSASTATSTTFISNISQTNGIISATKKTLPTANTTAAGIVKLSNTINNDEDKATTPKAVNDAIKNLGYTDPTDGTATETSTTFISNISQTNGVISATKKKLPTYTAGQGIKIKDGVISVIPPTKVGKPTCPGYTLYGNYFLSDTIIPNKNWNEACDIIEGVTVTQNYSYGDAQINTVVAKTLSKVELETLRLNQRKFSENEHIWYWTSTPSEESANNAYYVQYDGYLLGNVGNGYKDDKGGARLGFINPFG